LEWHSFFYCLTTKIPIAMFEPEQLIELKTRLDAVAKVHKSHSDEMVKDLRNDFELITDMRDSPEKTALENRFLQGLLYAEKATHLESK
jgi:hypothetical protein